MPITRSRRPAIIANKARNLAEIYSLLVPHMCNLMDQLFGYYETEETTLNATLADRRLRNHGRGALHVVRLIDGQNFTTGHDYEPVIDYYTSKIIQINNSMDMINRTYSHKLKPDEYATVAGIISAANVQFQKADDIIRE